MKSHSSAKTPGEGAISPSDAAAAISRPGNPCSDHCAHIDRAGRRCRQPALPSNDLCAGHARARFRTCEATADELLASVGDFSHPAHVNLFLGNLVQLVARRRIDRRDAVTMAYLCQLILNSQSARLREQDREEDREHAKPPHVNIIWDLPAPPHESAGRPASAVENPGDQNPGRGI